MININFKHICKLFLIFLILNFPTDSEGKEIKMKCSYKDSIVGSERILKYKSSLFGKKKSMLGLNQNGRSGVLINQGVKKKCLEKLMMRVVFVRLGVTQILWNTQQIKK